MIKLALQSVRIFLALSVGLGIVYPLLITLIGQSLFPNKANGSLIRNGDNVIASELLAQKVESPRLFWPRPSASGYGASPSGASNLGPTSEALKSALEERKLRGYSGEMLSASGSGLDPHISMNAAISQLPRIVESRKFSDTEKNELEDLIKSSLEKRDFGFLGEERINVLKLNLKLIERFGR